ncbi:MAG: glycosyltransferase [Lachnospiraceae bacterium]|nr:glycosyltransferase [Lachnospiraceae bacterium]
MKQKTLILLTNYYPYYKGEEYIENEIGAASSYFYKILVIPTMASPEMQQTRDVPGNVEILSVKNDCSFRGKIKMIMSEVSSVVAYDRRHKELSPRKLGLRKAIYRIYYLCRVESVYRKIVCDKQFLEFIKDIKEEDTILYSYWMHAVASITVRLKERIFNNNVRCITRGHRYDMYDYAAPCGFVPDRCYTFEKMDYIYPCSEDGVRYLKENYPNFADKIGVRYLGTFDHGRIDCSRQPYFVIVSCAGVRKVKRLDKIVALISGLLAKNYKIKWVHLGDGPDLDKITRLAKKKLKSDTFKFAGRLKNSEIYEWYKNNLVSCFVNLSDSEGVPVSIMEAMSFGIPIVATDVGGTREVVKNGENGFLFSKDADISKIEIAVEKIINMSQNEYEKMCDNSYYVWNKKSNANLLYKEFYDGLIEDS